MAMVTNLGQLMKELSTLIEDGGVKRYYDQECGNEEVDNLVLMVKDILKEIGGPPKIEIIWNVGLGYYIEFTSMVDASIDGIYAIFGGPTGIPIHTQIKEAFEYLTQLGFERRMEPVSEKWHYKKHFAVTKDTQENLHLSVILPKALLKE